MKSEYDFSQGKQGALDPIPLRKTRITITVDDGILEWFRSRVHATGGGNYQTLFNQALDEYLQNRTDLPKNEKELAFIFNTIINFINNQATLKSRTKLPILFWVIVPLLLYLSLILGGIIYTWSLKTNASIKTSDINLVIWVVISLFLFLIFVTFWFIRTKERQDNETIIKKNIKKLRDETLNEELIVKLLSTKSKETLKFSKIKIIDLLEEWQEFRENLNEIIPFASFLFLVIIIWGIFIVLYGIPIDFKETVPYVAAAFIVNTIIQPTIKFILKLSFNPTIRGFKRCLLLLEEAQAITDKSEPNKNITQSK